MREVAAELGIKPDLIYRWRSESKTYGTGSFPGNGRPKMTVQEAELAALRKKLKDAEMERDILKRPSPSSPRAIGKALVHDASRERIFD